MDNIRERISAILTWIKETWNKSSKIARLIFLGSVSCVLIFCLVLTLMLNHKTYVTLFDDLTSTENAQAIAILNNASIAYTVDNGRLVVEAKDEDNARLQLAVQGFANSGFTSYPLSNSGGLTATQQDKDMNTLHDLQNRLQATIELFPEVSKAVVTISVAQRNMFALQDNNTPASASVVIQKRPGRELTPEQVQGIINIVRDSVQGLEDSNISVVDERGDLKAMIDLNEDFNNKKLSLTEQVNKSLSDHILSLVQQPYGEENIRVVVMTDLNTDSRVAEQNTYLPLDPANPTNNPLDYAERDWQKSGDGTAAAQGVPGAQDNVQTPQYAAQETEGEGWTDYSGHDVLDYLVSSVREQIVKDGFTIEKASASILVNATSLPDGERDALIALASNASGISKENITVQSIKFAEKVSSDSTPGSNLTNVFIISGIGLLALCIILIIVLTGISRRRKAQLALEAEEAEQATLHDLLNEDVEYEPIALVESNEQKLKLQIKDLAESDPEIVAQLIKTWLVSPR